MNHLTESAFDNTSDLTPRQLKFAEDMQAAGHQVFIVTSDWGDRATAVRVKHLADTNHMKYEGTFWREEAAGFLVFCQAEQKIVTLHPDKGEAYDFYFSEKSHLWEQESGVQLTDYYGAPFPKVTRRFKGSIYTEAIRAGRAPVTKHEDLIFLGTGTFKECAFN